eukprot:CAMPEP_0182856498 /NCGR_PEP_ID=MMETSP0034_2-20130328/2472_1 /TAXON_ID=156128 /ORGANISM="Nephroselmis pyriformis, Strain CCMP717" /LENGTH=350 /DNA_ID=CAMNT_0024987581 /DNA_START=9 /DNA_END=1061 /DNA_ORIENTATION=+
MASESEAAVRQAAQDAEAIRRKHASPIDGLRKIDMRSDTVTKPTEGMRAAMALAEVGDDVFGDDPTVIELEAEAAKAFGKEAALFVPTGTMANLIACMVHCRERGSEVILGNQTHIHIYEGGGVACLAGIHPRALPNLPDGTLDLDLVEKSVRPVDDHFPTSRLLCLENTHNATGGRVLPVAYVDAAGAVARRHGMKLHIDGARIYNAAAALGVDVARLTQAADSVSFCLSKALGAPLGSLIVGTKEFVSEGRRARKALGGGMRQVGVVAAAGLVALREGPGKLAADHANAKLLARALNSLQHLQVDPDTVESNLVYVDTGALVSRDDVTVAVAAFVEALEDAEAEELGN